MTPKEKAIELVNKMVFVCTECDYNWNAKQCALIAVDEILSSGVLLDEYTIVKPFCTYEQTTQYWQQVRTEIENL